MSVLREIAVIGGGVVGLATAAALVEAGHAVSLVERRAGVGLEASFANGGQLSYRYVAPLADARVPREVLGWIGRPASPISLRLRVDPQQWRWMAAFLLACRGRVNRRHAAQLLALALESQQTLARWRQDGLDGFAWRRPGKLVLYRDPRQLERSAARVDPRVTSTLDASGCIAVEPAFAALAGELAGGLFSPDDEVADCHLFCRALLERLARAPNFRLLPGHASLIDGPRRNVRLLVDGRAVEADRIVLAAGLGARELARSVGIGLPLYGLRGYSLTMAASASCLPAVSVTDHDHRVVYATLGERLRIAAMVDLGDERASIDPRRIGQLRALARAALPALGDPAESGPDAWGESWAGLRPATPTGVPIIGETRWCNLILNVGHGALGFTLAAGSASRICDLIGKGSR